MADRIIVGLGEILWDMLPSGKVLGGAPANFAWHATRLGGRGVAVSAVGDDPLGREIVEQLSARGLRHHLEVVGNPTGVVEVTIDGRGVPSYNIIEGVAWDNIPFTPAMRDLAGACEALCFGSLAQRTPTSALTIRCFIDALPLDCLKIFDINLRQHYYTRPIIEQSMKVADILKINDEELVVVAAMLGFEGDEVTICRRLIDQYSLRMVILTRGAAGSAVITSDFLDQRGVAEVEVVDTVGAGDAFTAAFVVALLRGVALGEAHRLAVEAAGYVCTLRGAM